MPKIVIDGVEYSATEINERSNKIILQVQEIERRVKELENLMAVLIKAKRAYISELKSEILSAKSGFDFEI